MHIIDDLSYNELKSRRIFCLFTKLKFLKPISNYLLFNFSNLKFFNLFFLTPDNILKISIKKLRISEQNSTQDFSNNNSASA